MLLAHKAKVEAQNKVSDFIGFDNNDFVDCHSFRILYLF